MHALSTRQINIDRTIESLETIERLRIARDKLRTGEPMLQSNVAALVSLVDAVLIGDELFPRPGRGQRR